MKLTGKGKENDPAVDVDWVNTGNDDVSLNNDVGIVFENWDKEDLAIVETT